MADETKAAEEAAKEQEAPEAKAADADAGLLPAKVIRDGKLVRAGRKAADEAEVKAAAGAEKEAGEGDETPSKGRKASAK